MGADRALVEGAYRAAMAKVPGDYSKLYWQEAQSNINALKGVIKSGEDLMGKLELKKEQVRLKEEIKKKKTDEQYHAFQKVTDAMERKLSSKITGGKEEALNQDLYDLAMGDVRSLKERFKAVNTTGVDDTDENRSERNRIYGELQSIQNELQTFGKDILTLSKLNNSDFLSKEGLGYKKLYEIGEIINQDGDFSNVNTGREEGRGLFFEVDTATYEDPTTGKPAGWGKVKVYADEIDGRYNIKKAEAEETWWNAKNGSISDQVAKMAKQGNKSSINEQSYLDLKEGIASNMLTTDQAIADIGNRRLDGMPGSARQMFTDNPLLYTSTYGSFGVKLGKVVGDKDGKIEAEDFDTDLYPDDIEMILDAVFDTGNDFYNRSTSKEVISEVLALTAKKRHDDLVAETPPQPPGGRTPGITEMENVALSKKIEDLVSKKDFPSLAQIQEIALGTASNPIKIIKDKGDFVVVDRSGADDKVLTRFPAGDRERLQQILHEYTGLNPYYHKKVDFSKFSQPETTQYPGITKLGYIGEVKSR